MILGCEPIACAMTSSVRWSWLRKASFETLARFGCDHEWLPISCPSAAARFRISGYRCGVLAEHEEGRFDFSARAGREALASVSRAGHRRMSWRHKGRSPSPSCR